MPPVAPSPGSRSSATQSPIKKWNAESCLLSLQPGVLEADDNTDDIDDIDDIDGTTLHQPYQDEADSSGSDANCSDRDDILNNQGPLSKLQESDINTPGQIPSPDSSQHGMQSSSADLDPHAMLEVLEDLESLSDQILLCWNQNGISYSRLEKSIMDPTAKTLLEKDWGEKFFALRKNFGDSYFIDVVAATSCLPSVEHLNWMPDGTYQKANLARLALDMMYYCNKTKADSPLDAVDQVFPAPFIPFQPHETEQSQKIVQKLFRMGLDIRTQRCKLALVEAEIDRESIIQDIFHPPFADAALRGWELDGLCDLHGELPDKFYDQVQDRIRNIHQAAENDALEDVFPWRQFVVELCTWVRETTSEINDRIEKQERISSAIARLQTAVRSKSKDIVRPSPDLGKSASPTPGPSRIVQSSQKQRASTIPKSPSPELETSNKEQTNKHVLESNITVPLIRHVLGLRSRSNAPRSTNDQRPRKSPPKRVGTNDPPLDVSSDGDAQRNGSERTPRDSESEKRTFLRRQTNAQRISPIASTPASARNLNERARKRALADDDSESEGAFETIAKATSAGPSKRRRVSTTENTEARSDVPSRRLPTSIQSSSVECQSQPTTASSPPVASHVRDWVPDSPGSPQRDVPEERSEVKPGRVKWEEKETNELIRLMKRRGSRWSEILQYDAQHKRLLIHRKQGQLKDRARQILYDFLIARKPVPPGFENVNVETRRKAKLEEITGLEYLVLRAQVGYWKNGQIIKEGGQVDATGQEGVQPD